MTDAPSLFDAFAPAVRTDDTDTAIAAALMGGKVTLRARCLAALAKHVQGLTDFELAEVVGRQQTSAGKRRGELVDLGLVEASDERRLTPSGAKAIVWKITEQGKKEAA